MIVAAKPCVRFPFTSVEVVLPIRPHLRRVRIQFRTEVAEHDQRFNLARILESDAGFRAIFAGFLTGRSWLGGYKELSPP